MGRVEWLNSRYNDDKDFDGCSIFGMMNLNGKRFTSYAPVKAISNMHDRGNGLGGGFAIYGLYPEYEENYVFQIMFLDKMAKKDTDLLLRESFRIIYDEEIPTRDANVWNPPLVWRYFLKLKNDKMQNEKIEEYILKKVMEINTATGKAFVFSSGKDMAVFKGVGFPEDIAEYFCLDKYKGYMWICHGRFPTNTPGWWGGAHPFNILDWTVVHNGELSSYGINRRYLEMFGYRCSLQTDTEVLAYAFDLLMRRQRLPIEVVSKILAAPLWLEIDNLKPNEKCLYQTLRQTYGSLLMNGPFSVIVAHHGEMIGLTDRIKLRPLAAGTKDDFLYLSSEESAIRLVSPNLDKSWNLRGGEPVVGRLREKKVLEAIL